MSDARYTLAKRRSLRAAPGVALVWLCGCSLVLPWGGYAGSGEPAGRMDASHGVDGSLGTSPTALDSGPGADREGHEDGACAAVGAPTVCVAGKTCGLIPDGCGGSVDCGNCTAPYACGASGGPNANKCVCVPGTCTSLGYTCGAPTDGCGGTLSCGGCTGSDTCGGGGVSYQCGAGTCMPMTCQDLKATCGSPMDGCGNLLSCGLCDPPQTCGGGSVPNQCGCAPQTCASLNATCGNPSDGCGGALSCGQCIQPETCGGTPAPYQCGCTSKTCAELGAECGFISDGCGNTINCGTCTSPQVCGVPGMPNACAVSGAESICGALVEGAGPSKGPLQSYPPQTELSQTDCQNLCDSKPNVQCCLWWPGTTYEGVEEPCIPVIESACQQEWEDAGARLDGGLGISFGSVCQSP